MQETTRLAPRRVLLVRKQANAVVTPQMGLYQQPAPSVHLRNNIFTAQMLASYKRMIGTAIIVWVKISGVGVMIPPTMNATTTITRRCFAKKRELMIPIFASTSYTKGKSKIIPNGRINDNRKDRYWPSDNIGCSDSLPKPRKNLTAAGHTSR